MRPGLWRRHGLRLPRRWLLLLLLLLLPLLLWQALQLASQQLEHCFADGCDACEAGLEALAGGNQIRPVTLLAGLVPAPLQLQLLVHLRRVTVDAVCGSTGGRQAEGAGSSAALALVCR